jgi:hypothetical protein
LGIQRIHKRLPVLGGYLLLNIFIRFPEVFKERYRILQVGNLLFNGRLLYRIRLAVFLRLRLRFGLWLRRRDGLSLSKNILLPIRNPQPRRNAKRASGFPKALRCFLTSSVSQ